MPDKDEKLNDVKHVIDQSYRWKSNIRKGMVRKNKRTKTIKTMIETVLHYRPCSYIRLQKAS